MSMREVGNGLRFMLAGGFNTVVTYLIYLGLLQAKSYQISYAIAFVSGIAISYVLGRVFVFKTHRGYRSALLLPLVYLIQYLTGAAVAWLWVEFLHQRPMLAPAVSILITLPLTYFMSKFAFVGRIR